MRTFGAVLLFAALGAASGFAQNNTAAGLAGVGAGAALSSAVGPGSTTPSPVGAGAGGAGAGGAGSAPIEIQIMAFDGLRKIAIDVAEIVKKNRTGCEPTVASSLQYQQLLEDVRRSDKDAKAPNKHATTLANDLATVRADLVAIATTGPVQSEAYQDLTRDSDYAKQDTDKTDATRLTMDIEALVHDANKIYDACAILIEDPTSATQIALYQAVQGYYDHLTKLHAELDKYFSLQVKPDATTFPPQIPGQSSSIRVTFLNVSTTGEPVTPNASITGTYTDASGAKTAASDWVEVVNGCPAQLLVNQPCEIDLYFPTRNKTPPPAGSLAAVLHVQNGQPRTEQTIQLTGKVEEAKRDDFSSQRDFQGYLDMRQSDNLTANPSWQGVTSKLAPNTLQQTTGIPSPTPTPSPTPSPTGSGGGAAATPVDLQYLSGIMTALGGIKSNISYSPSSFQPTTQAFEVLIEAELMRPPSEEELKKHPELVTAPRTVTSYTSTSALNLADAENALSDQFGIMLAWGSQINNWATQCKPATGNPSNSDASRTTSPPASPPQTNLPSVGTATTNTACNDASVTVNLAVAQQMIAGYTSLLATTNDGSGSGNLAIVDVLRGKVLSDKMAAGIPSLQVAVAAAGGSTKTKSFFGVNLFYTFAPSYNAGVIATFELRDKNNFLLESGARNALYAYGNWKSKKFDPGQMKDTAKAKCGSFCSEE
jgi:hypothetical protein